MLTWGKLSSRTDFHGFKWINTDLQLEYVLFPPFPRLGSGEKRGGACIRLR